jgi:amino acid adenylation domain-containing protein
MSISNLIKRAADAGVFLFTEQNELRFKLSVTNFPVQIKTEILANKAQIIEFLAQQQTDDTDLPMADITPVERQGKDLDLSFSQQRFWFMDQLEGGSAHYNMPSSIVVNGHFDVQVASAALTQIIQHHEILRTTYHSMGEGAVQRINAVTDFTLAVISLVDIEPQHQDAQVKLLGAQDSAKVFNLSEGLMLRATWICLNDTAGEEQGVLLFNMHHIAADHWSMEVLEHEFMQRYQAGIKGEANNIAPLALQYGDYAVWQRNHFSGNVLKQQLDHWKTYLADIPQLHGVPTDFARPQEQTFTGRTYVQRFDEALMTRVKHACSQHQVTPYMFLQTLYALLLTRYSQSNEVVIGSPYEGRDQQALHPIIGCFLNSVLTRVKLDDNHSFSASLAQNKRNILDCFAHAQVPYDMIVSELGHSRSLSYSPVHQLRFTFADETAGPEVSTPDIGVKLSAFSPEVVDAKFDLVLMVTQQAQGIELNWVYNSDIFDPQTIANMATSFAVMTQSVLDDPQLLLAKVPYLSDEQQNQLQQWRAGPEAPVLTDRLDDLFEQQVVAQPQAVAICSGDAQLTFAELNVRANQLAHYLMEQAGSANKKPIGLLLERGVDTVVAILAAFKAGLTYVPMDTANPVQRVLDLALDANMAMILCHQSSVAKLVGFAGECIILDDATLSADLSRYADDNPPATCHDHDAAYVIYTSGSTGQPKGVVNSYANLSHFYQVFSQQLERLKLSPHSGWLWNASYAFDASIKGMVALAMGRKVVMASDEQSKDPDALVDLIAGHGIEVFNAPPLMMIHVIATLTQRAVSPNLMVSGDAVSHELWSLMQSYCEQTGTLAINAYGPTETTVNATFAVLGDSKVVTIGQPTVNCQAYVLNDARQPVPVGAVGELYISGDGLASHYLNNPAATEQVFVPCPWRSDAKMYRTGDLVRYTPKGQLCFIGRVDNQVKLRGYRIELAEVNRVLQQCDGIEQSLVLVEGQDEAMQLVAYVQLPIQGDEFNPQPLSEAMEKRLPAYMIPAKFVVVEQMPLTVGGKIDVRALLVWVDGQKQAQQQEQSDSHSPDTEAAPAQDNSVKGRLKAIWQGLLELDDITDDNDFFRLGGHSMLAVRMLFDIDREFGVKLGVKDLFAHLKLVDQAAYIESQMAPAESASGGEPEGCRLTIKPVDREGVSLPLSFAQQRLWFIDSMQGGSEEYNISHALKYSGHFDVAAANEAMTRIIARHESLRTVFVDRNGLPAQVVRPSVAFAITEHDLSDLAEAEQAAQLTSLARAESIKPFDLANDVMIRVSHIGLKPASSAVAKGALLFSTHHIASDAWSMAVLVKEFAGQYQAARSGQPDTLAPLEIQYADYAWWQRNTLADDALASQLDYWQHQLADLPVVHGLPLDKTRPASKSYQGELVKTQLSASKVAQLTKTASAYGMTPFMLMHSALALVMSRYGDSQDIVIGSPIANRLHGELEPLIGFFINSLVLRVNTAQPTLQAYLDHVKKVHIEAQEHQDVPFEQLVEVLKAPRSRSFTPLFQVLFNLNNTDMSPLTIDGLDIESFYSGRVEIKHDIEINAMFGEAGGTIDWTYDVSIWAHDRIAQMSQTLLTLLQLMSDVASDGDSDSALSALKVVDDQQAEQLIHHSGHHQFDFDDSRLVHSLIEARALSQPDDVAVVFAQQSLSYQALNARANQLASSLEEMGFEPKSLVGLCLKPSLEMLVTLLGIMKAGGVYVPLDHKQPKDRLSLICQDAELEWLVTQDDLLDKIPLIGMDVIDVSGCAASDNGPFSGYSTDNPVIDQLSSADLAYIIYTSGSTGQPKGVMVEHRQLLNYLEHCGHYFDQSNLVGAVVTTPLVFDATVTSVLSPLVYGKQVVLLPDEPAQQFACLVEYIFNHQNNWLFKLTPAHLLYLQMMAQVGPIHQAAHLMVLGGEQLNWDVLARWIHLLPQATFVNEYGPTEATVGCCVYTVEPGSERPPTTAVAIGKPIHNTRLLVLDEGGQLSAPGAIGELYIGGQGVTRGYFNLPEMTEQRFVDSALVDGERFYRSGDLVRYLADGNLEYFGRADEQVKIRGYRIEPGEIEHQIEATGLVSGSVVIAAKDAAGDDMLVAYLVNGSINGSANDGLTSEEQLKNRVRNALVANLPEYMQPAALVVINDLPLTSNGKVDKRALPAAGGSETVSEYVAPVTATEQLLSAIWGKQFGVQVGLNDSFFELGGHSLMVMRLLAELRRELGVGLSIIDVFTYPLLGELAAFIDAEKAGTHQAGQDNSSLDGYQRASEQAGNCLIKLNESDSANNVFCFHAGAGSAFVYRHIATGCAQLATFYGFQPPQVHLGQRFAGLVEMSAYYADLITTIQPQGPYHLIGFSMGGTFAYEVALQLKAAGHEIGHMAQLDNPYNSWQKDDTGKPWHFPIKRAFSGYLGVELDYDWSSLDPLTEQQGFELLKQELVRNRVSVEGVERDAFIPYMQYFCDMYWMYGQYQSQTSDFDMTVYVAEQAVAQSEHCNEYLDWDQGTSGKVTPISIGGDHSTMLIEPHLQGLVTKMKQQFEQELNHEQ